MPDFPTSIALTSGQLAGLEKLAKESMPAESCAFLLGRGENQVVVSEVLPMKNAEASRVSFTIAPGDLLHAYEHAEKKGLQVAGIFHSHPAPPGPSGTDAQFMEVNPVVWLIYSTTENRFAAWVFADRVREVKIARA